MAHFRRMTPNAPVGRLAIKNTMNEAEWCACSTENVLGSLVRKTQ